MKKSDAKSKNPEAQGLFSRVKDLTTKKDTKKPIKGVLPRIKNICRLHYKGLVGCIVPLVTLSWQSEYGNNARTVLLMWLWMIWFFLWHPVSVPVTGLIPLIMMPMTGVMSSLVVCKCYFTEGIILFILGSMLHLALNNSSADRRIALWLICSGDPCQFSPKRLIFKFSTAAFFLSLFSNRLITTSMLVQYANSAFSDMEKYRGSGQGANYKEIKQIVSNVIHTSASIGSIGIVHASNSVLAARVLFYYMEGPPHDMIFNYLQYSAFAFPVCFIMFVVNFGYHMLLINWLAPTVMDAASKIELRRIIVSFRSSEPKEMSCHERQAIFFTIVALLIFFLRKNSWMNGWGDFRSDPKIESYILDATVASIFVILLHTLPKNYRFLRICTAEKKDEVPPIKAESGILWWKFVDKNTNYGYFMLLGGGLALLKCIKTSGLHADLAGPSDSYTKILYFSWSTSVFLLCLVSAILCNIMTSVAVVMVFLPYVIYMASEGAWASNLHIATIAVGIACNFGFCSPFLFTPTYYYYYHIEKLPWRKVIKYNVIAILLCVIILWIALLAWAPVIWQIKAVVPAEGEEVAPAPSPEGEGRRI